jgi:uncharacterized integral membrane protein (TIGR00697 family)
MRITTEENEWTPKYLVFFSAVFCGLYMVTIALNTKMIDLFGWYVPAGLLTFPICAIITDILTEVYGFNRARRAIYATLLCAILFALLSNAVIYLPPAPFYEHQQAFQSIFGQTPRIALAGCAAWVVGEIANSVVLAKMKVQQNAKQMSLRFVASTAVGQLLDSTVFCLIAFVGVMPLTAIFWLILGAVAFKVAYEITALPLTLPLTRHIKKLEGVEHFDRGKLELI